jgi:hypothetical protein
VKTHVGVRPRLGLGGTDFGYWNKATWGIDLDVKEVHSIEADHVGVRVGHSEYRLFVLERVWVSAAGSADLLAAVKDKERFEGATVEIVDEHGHGVAEYQLGIVYVAFLEHEITGDGVMLERIGLRYLDVNLSG